MFDRGEGDDAVVHRATEYPHVAQAPMQALLHRVTQRQNRVEAGVDQRDRVIELEPSVAGQPGENRIGLGEGVTGERKRSICGSGYHDIVSIVVLQQQRNGGTGVE